MNDFNSALFLLAQRYCKRQRKAAPKHWYFVRKGPKNRKYLCHLCNKEVCIESALGPKTHASEDALNGHGMNHLKEHGLSDFIRSNET